MGLARETSDTRQTGGTTPARPRRQPTRASGTIIGVKAGVYGGTSPDGHLVKGTDCSGGQGADVNPNAVEQGVSTGTTAAWARYVCADGAGKNVTFTPGGVGFMYGSLHVVVQGSCFDFSTTMFFGPGGASAAQRVSNVQILGQDGCASDPASADCLAMYGLEIRGGKNILLKNVNYGPSLICAKNDPLITASFRCNPNGPPFESRFANAGTAQAGCTGNSTGPQCGGFFGQYEFTEAYIHAGDGSMYENVRVQHFYFHDSNTRFSGERCPPRLLHDGQQRRWPAEAQPRLRPSRLRARRDRRHPAG